MRVLLIAGGWSNEREVSLSGAAQIEKALRKLGHTVERFDPVHGYAGLLQKTEDCDFAFLNIHGDPGEDGSIQALLEAAACPYQGSGPAGSLRALNKAMAKELFAANNLPTPKWEFLPQHPGPSWESSLRLPVFLKPNTGGSSLGMALVERAEDLLPAVGGCLASHSQVLIEEYLPGVEVTCGILGDQALPPILIRPKGSSFFDYQSKYTPGGAEEICPAPISEQLTETVRSLALKAHECLGLQDYSRADFILSKDTLSLLEVNTLPGMTKTSLLPQAANAAGYSFEDLIARLMELGLSRANQQ